MVSFFQTVQSFVQFLWNWKLSDGKLVDQNTANLRALTCLSCHNNRSGSEVVGGCCGGNQLAQMAINKVRGEIVGNNKTEWDSSLRTCGLCGCDLKIKVWIPNQILLKLEDSNAYPTFCWNKKILENLEV